MSTRTAVGLVLLAAAGAVVPAVVGQQTAVKPRGAVREAACALETGIVPTGSLGHPVGRSLKIEGTMVAEALAHGACTLRVEAVNGERLRRPVDIWVENVAALPVKQRCVFEGYETFKMIGDPPAVVEAAKKAGRPFAGAQAGWQTWMEFIPLNVVAPKGLKLTGGPTEPAKTP